MSDLEKWLPVLVAASTFVSITLLLLPTQYRKDGGIRGQESKIKARIQVLVLGDIGRSPRMQYHALRIADHGANVDLIGYNGNLLFPHV